MKKLISTIVKNKMASEKKIIFFVLVFVFFGFSFLFIKEYKQKNSAKPGNSWEVYFENPKSTEDLTFSVKNYGKARKLHWKKMTKDDVILKDSDMLLSTGQKITIPLSSTSAQKGEKITIEVLSENGEKKTLYKNID